MFKLNRKNSPSELSKRHSLAIYHGIVLGIQKARIDEIERRFKPYKLPSVCWDISYISILKNEFEYMKGWYD